MLKQAPTLSLLTILMACGGKQSSQGDEVLTWTKDIEPIVQQNCVRCHNPNGTGVGDFTNLDQVTAFAEVMRQQIESGAMPPPASDPSCRDYEGSDILIMSEEDKARFSNWIDNGMPQGDPADGQTYDNSEYDLQDANLELMMQAPYQATFSKPQDNGNEYRCFALEHGQTEPFYITAMHPIVGNLKMSHHVIVGITDEAGLFQAQKIPKALTVLRVHPLPMMSKVFLAAGRQVCVPTDSQRVSVSAWIPMITSYCSSITTKEISKKVS